MDKTADKTWVNCVVTHQDIIDRQLKECFAAAVEWAAYDHGSVEGRRLVVALKNLAMLAGWKESKLAK